MPKPESRPSVEIVDDHLIPVEQVQPPPRMLSFYDRLRTRLQTTLAERKFGPKIADTLLLIPDVFMMLTRLSLDRNVPNASRSLIGGALLYFLLPTDLFPELLTGGIGYVDDLALALAVLAHAFGPDLEQRTQMHWSGDRALRHVLADAVTTASELLDAKVLRRLNALLAQKGIDIQLPVSPTRTSARAQILEVEPSEKESKP